MFDYIFDYFKFIGMSYDDDLIQYIERERYYSQKPARKIRVVKFNGEDRVVTLDIRRNRLNLTIDNNKVSAINGYY
jgi:hypothetical protein